MKARRAVIGLAVVLGVIAIIWQSAAKVPTFNRTQTQYIELCSGCHGVRGRSVPTAVPTLWGRVGYFLCDKNSRAYLGRLPNIALAPINDADLADLVNFVVFSLGNGSAPKGARPYTAEEIGKLRAEPLSSVALRAYRGKVVEKMIHSCGAPSAMLEYAPTLTQPKQQTR